MGVKITKSAGNLSTANNCYNVEAHNINALQNVVALTRVLVQYTTLMREPLTFANAGNFKGIVTQELLGSSDWGVTININQAQTVTFEGGNPGKVNITAHGLTAGTPIHFTTDGTLPTGALTTVNYYVTTAAQDITPTMTSDILPAPYATSASSTLSASYPAWRALDGGLAAANRWISNTAGAGWWKLDYSIGKAINGYDICVFDVNRAPTAWTFEGSNTGAFAGEETILDTQTGITGWVSATYKQFTFVNTTKYRYYRINITLAATATGPELLEVKMYETVDANSFYIATTPGGVPNNIAFSSSGTHKVWLPIATQSKTVQDITGYTYLTPTRGRYRTHGQYITNWDNFVAWGTSTPVTPAVTTDANKYDFTCYAYGGTTGITTYMLVATTGSELFYAAYCDNISSLGASGDTLIVAHQTEVDRDNSFTGVVGIYGSVLTVPTAMVICSNPDPTIANVCYLRATAPVAPYTLTFGGECMMAKHSGIQLGTSTVPLTYANQITFNFSTLSTGTTRYGFDNLVGGASTITYYPGSSTFLFYGTPRTTTLRATLAADAATGQNTIIVNEDVSSKWIAGDTVVVGKSDIQSVGITTSHTITGTPTYTPGVGTTITLSTNLATRIRKAGGSVILNSPTGLYAWRVQMATASYHRAMTKPSNMILKGGHFTGSNYIASSYYYTSDETNETRCYIENCYLVGATTSTFQMALADGLENYGKGSLIKVFEKILGVEFRMSGEKK